MLNIRKSLSADEANVIYKYRELDQRTSTPQRMRLSKQELDIIDSIRQNGFGIVKECEEQGIPLKDVKHYWHKSKKFSIFAKNSVPSYFEIRDKIVDSMNAHAPIYDFKRPSNAKKQGYLLVVDPADIHIGKLGKDHNNIEIVNKVHEGIDGLLDKTSGFEITQILFVAGNDILHVDNTRRTTTSGTPQDTDGMWHDNFLVAKDLYISILEKLLFVSDVHFVFNPSNHDYTNGFFLADTISSWFKNCDQITFDCSIDHRKYYSFGNNLIGTCHGDGAKLTDLPLLMAHEQPELWASCRKRYIYTHHVHHKQSKDLLGVTVESVRSPSGKDAWHDKNGYLAKRAIEAFMHDSQEGQIARFTQYV